VCEKVVACLRDGSFKSLSLKKSTWVKERVGYRSALAASLTAEPAFLLHYPSVTHSRVTEDVELEAQSVSLWPNCFFSFAVYGNKRFLSFFKQPSDGDKSSSEGIKCNFVRRP